MLPNFAVACLAVVGLLTAAALPADAGANTGTWRYWTPYTAHPAPPYVQCGVGCRGPREIGRKGLVGIGSRRDKGVKKAAPVANGCSDGSLLAPSVGAEFTERRVAEYEPWAGSFRRRRGRS